MRVFVTGATGFIGRHVAARLRQRDHEVVALVRTPADAETAEALGLRPVGGDLLDDRSWRGEAAQADALVHCAMIRRSIRQGSSWLAEATSGEIEGLKALFRAAMAGGRCRAIIDTSGTSALGDQGDAIVDEYTPPKPSLMGSYHRAGEDLVRQAAIDGLPAFSLRIGGVYAADGGFATLLHRASRGSVPVLGDGQNWISPVHIDDVAEGYALAIENPCPGEILHLVDDEPMRMEALAEILLNCFAGGAVRHVPKGLVAIFAGEPVAEMSVSSCRTDNDRARAVLGWRPAWLSARDGLPDVVARFVAARVDG